MSTKKALKFLSYVNDDEDEKETVEGRARIAARANVSRILWVAGVTTILNNKNKLELEPKRILVKQANDQLIYVFGVVIGILRGDRISADNYTYLPTAKRIILEAAIERYKEMPDDIQTTSLENTLRDCIITFDGRMEAWLDVIPFADLANTTEWLRKML